MKKENRNLLILLMALISLSWYQQKPYGIGEACWYDYDYFTDYERTYECIGEGIRTCSWEATCTNIYFFPKPSASGGMIYGEQTTFYCEKENGYRSPSVHINVEIEKYICIEQGPVLRPIQPSKRYFTTDEKAIFEVEVLNQPNVIVFGKVIDVSGQETTCSEGYTSLGKAEVDCDYLSRGMYTFEASAINANPKTIEFEVKGVMDLQASFTPLQPYNFIEGYVYLKDENGRGLGIYDIQSFDVTGHSLYGMETFQFIPEYRGKDNILGGQWYVSGNTGGYIGDISIDITVTKNQYIDATKQIGVDAFIPSLAVEAYCKDFDCPFPNTAKLDDTKPFKFYVKHTSQLVDASTYSVKVTNPTRTMIDVDITNTVLRESTGTYSFEYGPLSEVEAWTFTIHVTYPGTDPVTIYPKIIVTKEEPPIVFNPWLLLIAIPVIFVLYGVFRKKR